MKFIECFCGGPVAYDPCSNALSRVGALKTARIDFGQDGLLESWKRCAERASADRLAAEGQFQNSAWRHIVFCNPPYGRQIRHWATKIVAESLSGAEVVSLVPARTDTKWFQLLANTCQRFCIVTGRLKFTSVKADASVLEGQTSIEDIRTGKNRRDCIPPIVPSIRIRPRKTHGAPFPSAVFLHDSTEKNVRQFEIVFGTPVIPGERACGIVCTPGTLRPF